MYAHQNLSEFSRLQNHVRFWFLQKLFTGSVSWQTNKLMNLLSDSPWDISLWWWVTLGVTFGIFLCGGERPCYWPWDIAVLSVSLLQTLRHFLWVAKLVPVIDLGTFFCDDECPCYCSWDIVVLSTSLLLTLRHCSAEFVLVTDLETFPLWYQACPCYWPWDVHFSAILSVSLLLTLRYCNAECVLVTDLETLQCWVCPCYWPWDIAVLSLSLLLTLRHCSAAYVPVTDLETFLCGAQCVPVDSHVAMWLQEFLPNGALPWCWAPHHHHHFLALVNTSTPPFPCPGQHINPTTDPCPSQHINHSSQFILTVVPSGRWWLTLTIYTFSSECFYPTQITFTHTSTWLN